MRRIVRSVKRAGITRINSGRNPDVGFVNPTLYQAAGALRDITSGNNGAFLAAIG
jgi:kumamolisin